MLFTRTRDTDYIYIEGVTEYKYLGIWLDEKLTFNYYIVNFVSKLHQKIGFFYRNRTSFPKISRKRIVESGFPISFGYGGCNL